MVFSIVRTHQDWHKKQRLQEKNGNKYRNNGIALGSQINNPQKTQLKAE
jgi:hypothetical protein